MKNHYYFLYYFFDNLIVRLIRVFGFFLLGLLVFIHLGDIQFIVRLLPLYFLFLLQECFIHFKLESTVPIKKISDQHSHPIECVDFRTRASLERNQELVKAIHAIGQEHEVIYLKNMLNCPKIEMLTISEEEVLKKAKELVARVQGDYIHGVDIYASCLLLLDLENKVLFQNEISEEDVLTVLAWTRKEYFIDHPSLHRKLLFSGSGVFDFFVYGWSAQLARYAVNFTSEVLGKTSILPIARDREYDLLVSALNKSSSSNALLVGNAGVGKTSLVSELVIDSNAGVLPHSISNKTVFKLFPEQLIAGVANSGELESRFVMLFSELSHAGNIIVYIPNIENIFGGGGMSIDIGGSLVEYLKGNSIKIIGSTTPEAFKQYILPKQEVQVLFDIVEIDEPEKADIIFMLLEKSKELQHLNGVQISYDAIKEAISLSESYISDGTAMPGRAVRLLEDTISYCNTHGNGKITKQEVRNFVHQKTRIVLDDPTPEERTELLNLENELHKSIVSQDEAVQVVSNAMRRVRSGMKNGKRPIASFLFLGPTGVGKTETAKALASSYFGEETNMIRLDMSEYQNPESVDRFLGGGSDGYGETVLDRVRNTPFSLVLLDEFEKAYPRILDLFLQILDEGHLTDSKGVAVSFSNTIIIATSNAGSEFIREAYAENAAVSQENLKSALLEKIQQSNIYKPELINRFDDVVVFKPLSEVDAVNVAVLFLNQVVQKISEQQITLQFDRNVAEFVAKHSYSVEFGARNLRRFIEQSVENQLSKHILSGTLARGGMAHIVVEDEQLVIKL